MSDVLHQNLGTPQSNQQPHPVTLASATTIAPSTFITFVSGTVDITTITPPVTGQHMLVLIPTNSAPGALLTTGNILVGTTTLTQSVPQLLFYDSAAEKYYVG